MGATHVAPAIAVAGMHRSGTSMVARILGECGVYLGEPDQLVPATPTNPEGHFEHVDFLYVNKTVLRRLLGSWDRPPHPLAWRALGWRLRSLRERARELIDEMAPRSPWAWKDPRTSLTLPFWLPLLPNVRIVLCVREPFAVAASLAARDDLETRKALELWHAYNSSLLRAVPRSSVLVTAYERYFEDSEHEIRRLVTRLRLGTSSREIAAAAATVQADLRRQRPRELDALPTRIARLRMELLADARR
jgi:hypothetical protein